MSIGKLDGVVDSAIGKVHNVSASNIGKVGGSSLSSGTLYNRFYFPSTGTPDVSPSYHANWNVTGSAVRLNLVTTKIGSSFSTPSIYSTVGSSYGLLFQYISSALVAQTVASGTITGRMQAGEDNWNFNGYIVLGVRVCNSSGTITQNVIAPSWSTTGTNEFPVGYSSSASRAFTKHGSAFTYDSFSVDAGDRLVLEIGILETSDVTSFYYGWLRNGDYSSTDLPADETTTTLYSPWIEFSSGIYL